MKSFAFPLFILILAVSGYSATKTWDGGGADPNWQTAANWAGDVAPTANDDLVFPASALQQSNNNNFFILTSFNSITVEGGTYTFGGNPIRLVNGLSVNGGTATFNLAISLNGAQTFTALTGATATVVILTVGSFPITLDGAGTVAIGLISGSGSVTKNGAGIGAIIAASGFSGAINLNNGVFVVDASIPGSSVTVNSPIVTGGTLGLSGFGGTGTVGPATVTSGVISAGTLTSPTGILNLSGGLTFGPDGAYVCKIGGTSAGTNGHDQLNVTGTVTLNNARLGPLPWAGFRPAIGEIFVILRNDGTDAINGTFLNAPENAVFAGPLNTAFQISYHGGDGNDVTIKRVNRAMFDFDGDGKADNSVFRSSNGAWYELLSANNGFFAVGFGQDGDRITPADFDGDNKADVTVFRPSNGVWYSLRSSDFAFSATQFGADGDFPMPNDFDGDGRADFAVFRPATGVWYELRSLGGQFVAVQFGQNGDLPQMGDFDGDGMGDLAVYRGGAWYVLQSADNTFLGVSFGIATDRPVPADYDGDGKTDIAVYRDGIWHQLRSTGGYQGFAFGIPSDIPVAGDYDGDGSADAAVYRDGVWYMLGSTSGFRAVSFGLASDKPIPAAFN